MRDKSHSEDVVKSRLASTDPAITLRALYLRLHQIDRRY